MAIRRMRVRKVAYWWEAVCPYCGEVWGEDREHRRTFLMAVSHFEIWHSWHSNDESNEA